MNKRILIRTDGSSTIGLGHLIRMHGLATHLKDNFDITFFCRIIPPVMQEMIRSKYQLTILETEQSFLNYILPSDIVILDGYDFKTEYQLQVKKTGAKVAVIDDLCEGEYFADLIINHAEGVSKEDYRAQPYTKFALGLDYALLRPSFINQAKKVRNFDQIESALICVGGSDPKNLTVKILQGSVEYKQLKKIILITGSGYQKVDSLKVIIASDSRIQHFQNLNEQEMLSKMMEAELAIIPSSSILLEIMCCSCKILSFWFALNQQSFHEYIVRKGYLASFGNNRHGFNSMKFHQEMKKLLKNPSNISYTELRQKIAGANDNLLKIFKPLIE